MTPPWHIPSNLDLQTWEIVTLFHHSSLLFDRYLRSRAKTRQLSLPPLPHSLVYHNPLPAKPFNSPEINPNHYPERPPPAPLSLSNTSPSLSQHLLPTLPHSLVHLHPSFTQSQLSPPSNTHPSPRTPNPSAVPSNV